MMQKAVCSEKGAKQPVATPKNAGDLSLESPQFRFERHTLLNRFICFICFCPMCITKAILVRNEWNFFPSDKPQTLSM
jgi:hypothetical protein